MSFDTIISNTLIYDGSGRKAYRNDVGIKGDRIEAIGHLAGAETKERISAAAYALCPGFVDIHCHLDLAAHKADHASRLEPMVRQGVTTFVGGNCGTGLAPISKKNRDVQMKFYDFFLGEEVEPHIKWNSFGELMETYEKQGLLMNMAMLAPHSILRMNSLGIDTVEAQPNDIREMKELLIECLEAGAIGLSTGLQYPAGLSSNQQELTELARMVHDYNGVFTSHLRSYNSDTIGQAIDEVIGVGRDAEVPVQISHLFWVPNFSPMLNKLSMAAIRGASSLYSKYQFPMPTDSSVKPYLDQVAACVADGVPVGIDAMPTSAGFTHVLAFFPPWALSGGMNRVKERLENKNERKAIRESIENGDLAWPHRGRDSWSMNLFKVMGWGCAFIMSVGSEKNKHLTGRSFKEIGEETGRHPFDVVCDLLLEEEGRVLIFETATHPGDPLIERSLLPQLLDPNTSIVTDSIPLAFGKPSHLFYDCFPKFLGQYARDWKGLSLEEAIRKCTSLPAKQMQIHQRGHIREGCFADLVLFNPKTIASNSTAMDPCHYPDGIEYVFINGRAVVDPEGFHPDPLPGKLMRRGAM